MVGGEADELLAYEVAIPGGVGSPVKSLHVMEYLPRDVEFRFAL